MLRGYIQSEPCIVRTEYTPYLLRILSQSICLNIYIYSTKCVYTYTTEYTDLRYKIYIQLDKRVTIYLLYIQMPPKRLTNRSFHGTAQNGFCWHGDGGDVLCDWGCDGVLSHGGAGRTWYGWVYGV